MQTDLSDLSYLQVSDMLDLFELPISAIKKNREMDVPTNGRTDPGIEMRGRI